MTALAISMIADVMAGHQASFLIGFIRSIKRYFGLLFVWGLIFASVFFTSKYLPKFFHTQDASKQLLFTAIYFLVTIVVQILFIYIVPIMIVKNKSVFVAIKDNIAVVTKLIFPTLFLGLVPALLYVPTVLLKSKSQFLVEALFPEVILGIIVLGIIVSVIVEIIVVTSTTVLFINKEVK